MSSKKPKAYFTIITILGEPSIGKSLLIKSYQSAPGTTLDKHHITTTIDGKQFKIRLNEGNNPDRSEYIASESHCLCLCFSSSLISRHSFDNLIKWIPLCKENKQFFLLLGNNRGDDKSYSDEKDTTDEAKKLIQDFNLKASFSFFDFSSIPEVKANLDKAVLASLKYNKLECSEDDSCKSKCLVF